MGFDAGALLFKIQAVGAELFKRDMRESKSAIDGVEQASKKAAGSADDFGKSSDSLAKQIREVEKQLAAEGNESETLKQKLARLKAEQAEQKRASEEQAEAAKKLTAIVVGVGLAVSAAVGLSVAKWTEFDKQMSATSASIMANKEQQRQLADAALDAGADTAYSATEAAAAEEELAKAGQKVSDIVGGSLKGALALAAAGQLEVARSAEIMATVLTQFRLPARDAAHVADVLAAGAGKAQGSVQDMGLAMSYVGPLAKSFGWSLEETAGTIAYFSSQGVMGEKAGTALRGVLAALQAPSAAATKVMNEYGIQIYDASGKMLGAAGIANEFKTKLGGLTDQERQAALGRIFGNESLLAATLLYEGGAPKVKEWTEAVNDAGYAAEQAKMRQDNLAGDIEKLGGALDTALIKTGSGANDIMRELVQSLTALIDIFGEAPPAVTGTILVLGIATGAIALFTGGTVIARLKLLELKSAFDTANASMSRTALLGGAVGLALTGIITIVSMLAQQQAEAKAKTDAYADSLESGTNRITHSTRELATQALAARNSFLWMQYSSVYDEAEKLGISLDLVTDAATGNVDALKQLKGELDAVKDKSLAHAAAAGAIENAVKRESGSINEAIQLAEQKAKADDQATESSKKHEDALAGLAGKAQGATDNIKDLVDAIMNFGSAELDTREAARNFQKAIDDLSESVKNNGTSLDIGTEKGRANESALDDIAQAAIRSAGAILQQTGSQDQATAAIENGRNALIDALGQFGITGQAAQDYADKLGLIPSNVHTAFVAETTVAEQRAQRVLDLVNSMPGTKRINVVMTMPNGAPVSDRQLMDQFGFGSANGNVVEAYANGGTRYENHVAQMARAGAMRVWAEPETGGETYVPHAISKRSRSEQLMAETAAIFGGMYIPQSAMQSTAAGAPSTAIAPSLAGLSIEGTLQIDGDGFARLVDGRILSARYSTATAISGGSSSR